MNRAFKAAVNVLILGVVFVGSAAAGPLARDRLERARLVRERLQIKLCLLRGRPVPHALRDRQLAENFGRAAALYRPQPWQGKAILFRAESVPFVFSGGGLDYGWDSVVLGGVKTVMIPGNHATLLLGPNAKVLMGPLNAALDQANLRIAPSPHSFTQESV